MFGDCLMGVEGDDGTKNIDVEFHHLKPALLIIVEKTTMFRAIIREIQRNKT